MNRILIHKKNILYNYRYLQSLRPHATIFPVLKSNGYGHGLTEMTKILNHTDAPYLVIDSIPEYFQARKFTRKKFLLLGETLPHNYKKLKSDRVTFVVYNVLTLEYLLSYRRKFTVHFFLNTGMNREGFDMDGLHKALNLLRKLDKKGRIIVEGVMSHFATADEANPIMVEEQIQKFKDMYNLILEYGYAPKYRHIGNSAAILGVDTDFFDAWRAGISLYGYNPLEKNHPKYYIGDKLLPALDVRTKVVSTHKIKAGDGVSYNFRRGAEKDTQVATLAFGYYEGLFRSASGKITFKHKKNTIAQIGTICMNLCVCESDGNLRVADDIQLISSDKESINSLEALANASGVIVYECLVNLDSGIRREVV